MFEALSVFHLDQRRRLSRRTFDQYDAVITDCSMFLYHHGPDTLSGAERALLANRVMDCGCVEHDYLTRFGPEHILRNLDAFLELHRGPKRIADERRAAMTLRVTRKLRAWLIAGGWHDSNAPRAPGSPLTRLDFEQVHRLTKTLAEAIESRGLDYEDVDSDDDLLDAGLYDVSQIRGDDLWLDYWPETGNVQKNVGPVHFPAAAKVLQPGWVVGCTLGRVHGDWCVLEASCVFTL
jgi:hypothetical protein